ncbi:MAG: serine hydrolase domain-containing protein [Vicinamibacterales bacterium]
MRLAATAGIALACAAALRAAAQPSDPFAGVASAIHAEMAQAGIPGAAVAVVAGNQVVWTAGFGVANTETEAPVTPDTLFQIGSVTKTLTAAAILVAAAEGVVALDQPVATYVTGLTPCVGTPTLAQLLSHTGGLIDEPDEFGPQGEDGLGAYQRTWTGEYCFLPPGRAFSYSNSGFALAGLALQEADGTPFAEVMKARVLGPLGMTRTTFRPTEAMTRPLAVGHKKMADGTFEVVRPLANDARLWPAGTLYSSANEMARLVVALGNDGIVEGRQALPPGVGARMRRGQADVPTNGEAYGQGLFLRPAQGRYGHGGTMTGYAAQLTVRGQVGLVALTNADAVDVDGLVGRLWPEVLDAEPVARHLAALRRAAADSGPPSPPLVEGTPALRAGPLTSEEAARYLGRFANPRRFTVEVVARGPALILKRFGRDFPMRALATPGRFLVDLPRGGTETIVFGLGPDGRADYLQMNVWALARLP